MILFKKGFLGHSKKEKNKFKKLKKTKAMLPSAIANLKHSLITASQTKCLVTSVTITWYIMPSFQQTIKCITGKEKKKSEEIKQAPEAD